MHSDTQPDISVIIPVFNDDRLRLCLDALARQSIGQDRFEVVVVDNGSKTPPRALVERYPFARYAEEATPGSYAARNHAMRLVRGRILAFTDSDCLPAEDWLEAALRRFDADESLIIIGGRIDVFPRDSGNPNSAELVDIAFGFDQERSIGEYKSAVTGNLIARREAFNKVGDFNQNLLSGGDGEWCGRADKAGIPVVYGADVAVAHPARASLRELILKQRRTVAGKVAISANRTPRTRSFWVTAVKRVTPDFRRILYGRRRLRDRGYTGIAWVRMGAVVLIMQYAGLLEFFRLKLGGTAERR